MFLTTKAQSLTGPLFYSDQWWDFGYGNDADNVPFLNSFANVPILGRIAGVVRLVLALIHAVGHSFAAIFISSEHLKHVAKGGTELLRGVIESIPVVGEIFSWCYNPNMIKDFLNPKEFKPEWNFFLIKITNPDAPDLIDRERAQGAQAPYDPMPPPPRA